MQLISTVSGMKIERNCRSSSTTEGARLDAWIGQPPAVMIEEKIDASALVRGGGWVDVSSIMVALRHGWCGIADTGIHKAHTRTPLRMPTLWTRSQRVLVQCGKPCIAMGI
jgi:hypothetical protein